MTRPLLFLLTCFLTATLPAQKLVHIPNYLQDPNNVDGSQFTWNKTAQSPNFILIWGNTVGTNPANYPSPDLRFNPAAILDTLEKVYSVFLQLGFANEAPGTNLSQYKIPVVIYGTWGTNGAQGFANGGDADGIIGAFWVHPNAMHDGGVAAHELAHSLQAQSVIDARATNGLGPVWLNSGIFWETHANFMRNLMYPQFATAWGMDVYHLETWGDWKNTYENYELLFAIKESEGIGMVNRLWRESLSDEYPLQAYKRLAGYSQKRFNDSLYHYARRMTTFDFTTGNIGKFLRQYRQQDLNGWLPSVQNTWSILKKVPGTEHRYEIPIEQAPEEYAYNVIPLYPHPDSCSVIVKFKGHTEANTHAGWRYGFVAARADGTISRYSPDFGENTAEINFTLEGNETRLYFVVMGAPFDQITTNPSNDTWHGYPKHFRFPYELSISGAVPEGFQTPATFRAALKVNGHLHTNGGGWVQNSASVASTVFVGPAAMVLGNSVITGQVRIENTALVKDAAISNQVKILDNAFVNGGKYSGQAIVRGNGYAEKVTMQGNAVIGMRARVTNYSLSGNIEVGGDVLVYNETGNCNNGVYYRLTNYYDDKLLECDGRTANHPVNQDVNSAYTRFSDNDMALQCHCFYTTAPITVDSTSVTPPACNTANGSVQFHISNSCGPFRYAWSKGAETGVALSGLAPGNYSFTITDQLGRELLLPVLIPNPPALTASLSATSYDCNSSAGGNAVITINSGTAPFQYIWEDGATSPARNNLTPGPYSVTATDALGCRFTEVVEIPVSGQLDALVSSIPPSCYSSSNGSATVSALNGTAPFQWLWENGATASTRTGLAAGHYQATVTDVYGCQDTLLFSLVEPPALLLQLMTQDIRCFDGADGSVAITPGGGTPGYTFLWNTLDTTLSISTLSPGLYTVIVTDANGCTASKSTDIAQPARLLMDISGPAALCPAQSGLINTTTSGGSSPYTFLWNNTATGPFISVTGSGVFAATVTDAHGCVQLDSFVVAPGAPLDYAVSLHAPSCANSADGLAAITPLTGVAPYTWHWEQGTTDSLLTHLNGGSYAVTLADAVGCSSQVQVQLPAPEPLMLLANAVNSLCYGDTLGAAGVEAEGGTPDYSYLWNDGQTNANAMQLSAGTYTVTVSDQNGCIATTQVSISSPDPLELSLTFLPEVCPGHPAHIITFVEGGVAPYSYLWNTGALDAELTNVPGTYTVTVTDAHGCTSQQEASVQEVAPVSVEANLIQASAATAADGAILMNAVLGGTSPYTFLWNTGAASASLQNVLPGDYSLTVTDAQGCEWTFHFTITFTVASQDISQEAFRASVIPNPSAEQAWLVFQAPSLQTIDIILSDVLGRVLDIQHTICQEGDNTVMLPTSLAAGVYRILLQDASGTRQMLQWVVVRSF